MSQTIHSIPSKNFNFLKLFFRCYLICTLLLPVPIFGESRLTPDSEIEAIAAIPEPLPIESLIHASLIASGTATDEMAHYSKILRDMIGALKSTITGNDLSAGETLLYWMHSNYLSRYIETQTRLDVLLETGRYNCVSSSVLYIILARAIDLEIHGVVTTDHAFCRLPQIGNGIDVETTNPYGYDPGSRLEARDLFEGQTGFVYVPPGNYNLRRDVGEKEFISLIYLNRISLLQNKGEWSSTVGLALDRWVLSSTDSARKDFVIAINNVAAAADRQGNPEEILMLLNNAAAVLGEDHELEGTAMTLFGNTFARYWNANRINDALELIENPEASRLISPSFLEEKRREIKIRLVEEGIQKAPFHEALSMLEEALDNGYVNRGRWTELALYLWSSEAKKRSVGGEWIKGWELLQEAPSVYYRLPKWDSLVKTYEYNASIVYHNLFVKSFKNKEWAKARKILTEGLSLFPANEALLKDVEILNQVN